MTAPAYPGKAPSKYQRTGRSLAAQKTKPSRPRTAKPEDFGLRRLRDAERILETATTGGAFLDLIDARHGPLRGRLGQELFDLAVRRRARRLLAAQWGRVEITARLYGRKLTIGVYQLL